MPDRQIKWPKWTEHYEEIKENNKTILKVTRADRAWNHIDDLGAGLVSAVRHMAAEFRKSLAEYYLR